MTKSIFTALLTSLLFITVPSFADPMDAEGRQAMQTIKKERAKLMAKERLLRLKQTLNLKKDQMDAWTTYEKHILENVNTKMQMLTKLRQNKADTGKPPSSIDLAKVNIERLDAELSAAKTRLKVFSKLYNILNDEQKATVDKLALRKIKTAARKARKARKPQEHKKTQRKQN